MGLAAEGMKTITMELGGHSPVVVFKESGFGREAGIEDIPEHMNMKTLSMSA